MNFTEYISDNITTPSSIMELHNPCPRQRNITRPFLFIHNYILLCFGSILNFLAFAILIQRSLRYQSTFAYLAFLSLSNGLLSFVRFSKWMSSYYFQFAFDHFLITCRLHRFLSDFLTHFSLSTLICVNIDRARTVTANRPNSKYPKSKFRQVLMKECLIACILCAFHFHWFVKYGYEVEIDEHKTSVCDTEENEKNSTYNFLITKIYPPFELVVFFCLPLIINIICTIIIVRSLRIRMKTAKQFHSTNKSSTKPPTKHLFTYFLPKTASQTTIYTCFGCQIRCRKHTRLRLKLTRNQQSLLRYDQEYQRSSSAINENSVELTQQRQSEILLRKQRSRRTRDIHLSAMLIGLNILYILLNLPFNLHQTFRKGLHNQNEDFCVVAFISLLLDALQQTFFATNFFLYILTNRRFREELYNNIISMISYCKKNPRKYRRRLFSSTTPVSMAQTSIVNENNLMVANLQSNQDTIESDYEITDIGSKQQTNENSKSSSKLITFKQT